MAIVIRRHDGRWARVRSSRPPRPVAAGEAAAPAAARLRHAVDTYEAMLFAVS